MMVYDMKLMPSKVIGREVCLQVRGPFGLSDPRPKKCPNIWRKEKSKEIKDFMKVEEGVHYKRFDGRCIK
jgi:hypothetical protein